MKTTIIFILLSLSSTFVIAQTPWVLPGNTVSSGDFLGTTNAQPLELKTTNTGTPQPINFYTGNTQRVQITTTGNINLNNTGTEGYMINGERMLWHNDEITNVFVGVDAGNTSATASHGTFVGHRAGISNTAWHNTFIGHNCGASNTVGSSNTFVGDIAGQLNTTGFGNTFIGANAYNNTTGYYNIALGIEAGTVNTTGIENTFIGAYSNSSSNNLQNATAVGCYAQVGQSNSLVLGSISGINEASANTNVGIGTTAPKSRLHINDVSTNAIYVQFSNSNTGVTNADGFHIGIGGGGKCRIASEGEFRYVVFQQ